MNVSAADLLLREDLAAHRLLAIVRGTDAEACVRTAVALVEEGVRLLEVSLTTVDAHAVVARIAAELGDRVRLGVGTALTPEAVRRAHDAGAGYILTPALCDGLDEARRLGLPVIPGALTPSEVHAAATGGAAAVKLFPAGSCPASYLGALRQPFPDVPLLPVGGVDLDDIAGYFEHGALAVGVGSPLCGDAPDGGGLRALRQRARAFVQATGAGGTA